MSLIGKANDSVDLVKNALDAKIALATAEDKDRLAEAKLALADLKTLIADQKDQIQTLTEKLKKRNDYVLEEGVYWMKSDKEKDQPFCPACYTKDKLVPLQKLWDCRRKNETKWVCPEKSCVSVYNPWEYKEPDPELQEIGFY